ncbi:hypothetical protein Tco_1503169 [Tanacetum coccineum]
MSIACDFVACGRLRGLVLAFCILTDLTVQSTCPTVIMIFTFNPDYLFRGHGHVYYRIHISQLSVIAAAKVSYFEILCRVHDCEPTVGLFRCFYVNSKNKGWMSFSKRPGHDAVCYTKPLDSLKGWNDHFFWVDAFACPASFSWHTGKILSKDPFTKSTEFNAKQYAFLLAYPAPFHKYPEPFLCLVGMSHYYTLDENTYPKFLYENGEEMDLFSFVCTADLTKVRIGERQRGEDEPKLLDTTVGRVVPLLPVAPARGESELEDNVDRLFDEEGCGSEASRERLLAGAVQNVTVRGEPVPSLPFVTSSVSTMPEREDERHTDTLDGTEVGSLIRSSAPAMTTATIVTVTVGAAIVVKETVAKPSLFATGCSSVGGTEPIRAGFSDLTGNDFLHDQLFAKFNVGAARQMTLSAEVRMRAEYNIKEKRRLKSVVDDQSEVLKAAVAIRLRAEASKFEASEKSLQDEIRSLKERNSALEKKKGELDVRVVDLAALVKVREQEAAALDAVVATVKLQNGRLIDQVHELETSSVELREKVTVYENCMSQLKKFQDERMKEVNDKFEKLDVDVIEMALHLEERFYPHLLTTIAGRRWLLTHSIKLAIVKCLHSPKYLSGLGAAISRAIEKGMQDGLAVGIIHGQECRVLSDVAAFNPFAKSDYISALQKIQDVNFSLLAELKSNKDANIETLMNILRLEEPVAEKLGLQESQPHEDQLMVPIHHSPDQTVVGATSLSALRDVFVSIVEPLSSVTLEGTKGTSDIIPETTTALSVTFDPVSSIPPISMDDYEIAHADD